ncbi:MAG: hypothetical protein WCF44_16125, partial [Candidatus Methylophosphatis roskildensis]
KNGIRKRGTDRDSFAPANASRRLQFPDESGHELFELCPLLRRNLTIPIATAFAAVQSNEFEPPP